jgi:citrate lyase subunit gamma (acyl carrier protein)
VTPSESFELDYAGANKKLFLKRTEGVARQVLAEYSVENARLHIQDQGALEATLRARIETALERAMENLGS